MSKIALNLLIISIIIISQTYAFPFLGSCPESPVISNFNSSRYTGLWYESERFPSLYENSLSCVTATYALMDNAKISVLNYGIYLKTNKTLTSQGTAYVPNSSEPNKLIVEFPFTLFGINLFNSAGNYHVWSTDYDNLSLVYSCKKILFVKLEYAWILSRSKTPDQTQVNNLKSLLASKGVDIKQFEKVQQTCSN